MAERKRSNDGTKETEKFLSLRRQTKVAAPGAICKRTWAPKMPCAAPRRAKTA